MARKGLLDGLMKDVADTVTEAVKPPPKRATPTKGAIGAVSQSIADLKSRAIEEIDPNLIDDAGLQDRLGEDADQLNALAQSIAEHGQQVPVLLRPAPSKAGRYEIVYGRRRVAAIKANGGTVKALIRDLDDAELVLAQGQENSARRDLSFIEKANFARQMVDAGYARKEIAAALHIDKTVISRMLQVSDKIPQSVIILIGPAFKSGRDRWLKLADMIDQDQIGETDIRAICKDISQTDARFEAVMLAATQVAKPPAPQSPKPRQATLQTNAGVIGQARWGDGHVMLKLNTKASDGFEDWLVENMNEIHARWSRGE